MATKQTDEPDVIGKAHAGERARDEQRTDGGPRYGGEAWDVADKRGENRFGVARNDDADPSELGKGQGIDDDTAGPDAAQVEDVADDGSAESGGQHAGMGRGEEPRKAKTRER